MLTSISILAIAYVIGSIPTGYLLVRAASGEDVRSYGSHSIGAINVFRVGGRWLGTLTVVMDTGKALAVVLLTAYLTTDQRIIALSAFAVALGHSYSIWLLLKDHHFSEAKSVACTLGVFIALGTLGVVPWWSVMLPVGIWICILLGGRLIQGRWPCISIATMSAIIAIPVSVLAGQAEMPYAVLSIMLAALVLLRHKNNIRRLRAGIEPHPGEKGKVIESAQG